MATVAGTNARCEWPAGGGEMGERIRTFDWASHPLGPVKRWPQALRTSVSTCLDCAFPIVIWWGSELVILYNDEYRPILGSAKHPAALGACGSKVWPEIWDIIGPMLSRVLERGEATRSRDLLLHIERHGYPEEAYFSFSYSPIRDDGDICGIFCPVIETTEKVIGERRLCTLRDLAAECNGAESESAAFDTAARVLAANPHDVPFALIYSIAPGESTARLAASAGIEPDTPASPRSIAIGGGDVGIWSISAVARTGRPAVVDDLSRCFEHLPTGAWGTPPRTALVLPMLLPGQDQPRAILVAAVSPMRPLDENYRTFFGLMATQLASALADSQALAEERKRAEALAELDRAKTIFFTNVSHEFRTPLTLILGPLEDALAATAESEGRQRLELSLRNARRLQKLVNTLLDFSRIEAGRLEASYQPTDLAALTTELASVFRSAVEMAGLRLIIDCGALNEPVYVDRDMYEKVVLNLLSNAFKFTLEGEIEVALRDAGAVAELSVRDTGTGIAQEQLPQIFERFHRVEGARARTQEGTGIGLALVRELVKLHGGSVGVRSMVGEGTMFVVTIPKGKAHLPADRIAAPRHLAPTSLEVEHFLEEALRWLPDTVAGPGENGRASVATGQRPAPAGAPRPRILWADDNADMRQYVRRLLAPLYDVEAVANGMEALAAVGREPPDLVLADVMMPGLDGFGLLQVIRGDERTRTIPVILLSARAGEEAKVEGLTAGADDYLIKPFTARELLAHVGAHLEMARVRRESTESLRESEARFRTMADDAPVMVWVTEPDGRCSYLSRSWYAFTDQTPGAGLDFGWMDALHPDDRRLAREVFTDANARRESFRLEYRLRHHDGSYRWAIDSAVPRFSPNGQFLGYIGSIVDITEHRRAQELIGADLDAMTLLHEVGALCARGGVSEPECLQRLLEVAISLTGADKGTIQLLDSESGVLKIAAQRGFSARFLEFFAEVDGPDAASCGVAMALRQRTVVANVSVSPIFAAQTALDVLLGEGVCAVQSTPLLSSTGSMLGMVSTHFAQEHQPDDRVLRLMDLLARQAADYLERHHTEQELERSREVLREADRRKDEFLATLAHELRNPLAPIRNGLQLIKLSAGDREAVEQVRSMMERQIAHMVRLVDDLLDLSRISRGTIVLKKSRVRLEVILRGALDASRPLMEAAGHRLSVDLPPETILIDADETRLAQVFSNLLNNAAKYTEPGGHIRFSADCQGDEVVITVEDSGVGIPAAMLPRVFEMFTQVDRSLEQSQGGLGIGLSIARQLVEMHAGSIEAHSDGNGLGSRFLVRLPVAAPLAVAVSGRRDHVDSAAARQSRRILVVDDNIDSASTLSRMLKLMGNVTRTAHDGLQALDAAAEFRPDVMLMDIGMPRLNGYDAAQRIRAEPWGRTVVLVALTGWGQEEDRRRALESGFDHHMTKPVDPAVVEQLLATLGVRHSG
jgi:PAS domain S-box-containing protein